MTNPWLALPTTAPYVLPAEHNKIERFNHAYPEPDYRIRLNAELLTYPLQPSEFEL